MSSSNDVAIQTDILCEAPDSFYQKVISERVVLQMKLDELQQIHSATLSELQTLTATHSRQEELFDRERKLLKRQLSSLSLEKSHQTKDMSSIIHTLSSSVSELSSPSRPSLMASNWVVEKEKLTTQVFTLQEENRKLKETVINDSRQFQTKLEETISSFSSKLSIQEQEFQNKLRETLLSSDSLLSETRKRNSAEISLLTSQISELIEDKAKLEGELKAIKQVFKNLEEKSNLERCVLESQINVEKQKFEAEKRKIISDHNLKMNQLIDLLKGNSR
ncbi:hypothetical protein RCL1_000734 [Eukaryota sp. TZLM3-RCL]